MDIEYCNGQKRYDFSADEGFYHPGCNPMKISISDIGPKAFRKAYVTALFAEDECWLTAIEKHHMVVPGSPLNRRDKARDQDTKAYLRDQVNPDTLMDRKAFYEAWREAPCCADDCDQYCEECSNKGIKFKSIPTYGLDSDVRRFITKYGRYQTASELKRETNDRNKESKIRAIPILSRVCDRKSDNEAVRIRGQERDRLLSEPEEASSDQAERIEALLLHPISEEMVT